MAECVPQMSYRIPIMPLCNICWPRQLTPGRENREWRTSILVTWFAMSFQQIKVRQKQGAVTVDIDWL
jgi:hypothetical protein